MNPRRPLWLERPLKPSARYQTANVQTIDAALVCIEHPAISLNRVVSHQRDALPLLSSAWPWQALTRISDLTIEPAR
jgi:hypothetical protein